MKRGVVLLSMLAAGSESLHACPVCSGPVPQAVQDAYLGITLLLSALPVVLLAAGWWLARRFRDPREGGA